MKKWNLGLSSALFSHRIIQGKLKECYDAGFQCVEVVLNNSVDGLSDYVNSIVEEAKDVDIKVWSIHLPFGADCDISEVNEEKRSKIVEDLFQLIDITSPLKAQVAVIHGSYEPIKPEDREDKILASIKSLKALVAKCSEYGMKLAIECLPRTCIGNCSSEMLRILKEVDNLYVCFDTNHLTIERSTDFVRRVGKYIVTTHVSDYDGIDEKHWLPGKGSIDWKDILSSLEAVGYDGPILFEVANKSESGIITPKIVADNWNELVDNL